MPTLTDIFAGAGGSSTGAIQVPGVEVRLAANHWKLAVDVHNQNHPNTEHALVDLHLEDPRNFPRTDILWASPECTKWSVANSKAAALSVEMGGDPTLFDDVPDELITTDQDEIDRSRLLMFDVLRFIEHHRYRFVIVENVVDIATQAKYARAWELWRRALRRLGYRFRVISLNSMHAQYAGLPAPQSRDRLYIAAWPENEKAPNIDRALSPRAWCPRCDGVTEGRQAWKNGRTVGRYKAQYIYVCHACGTPVEPAWLPASTAIVPHHLPSPDVHLDVRRPPRRHRRRGAREQPHGAVARHPERRRRPGVGGAMSEPYFANDMVQLYHGDCREVMRTLADDSVDAIVTDPPYELGFMGRAWDRSGIAYDPQVWAEALRVLKPGGHLLAFGGTRTWHRLAAAIEDAGFEVRDSIAWLYGSGFPKSLDIGKAIDRAAGAEREVVGEHPHQAANKPGGSSLNMSVRGMPETAAITAPATEDATRWQGWGTALKPAFEPIVVARKPVQGPLFANVLAHGTGALNIDACRVAFASEADERESKDKNRHADFGTAPGGNEVYGDFSMVERSNYNAPGRWPPNVALDDSQAAVLDEQAGPRAAGNRPGRRAGLGYGSTSQGTAGERQPLDAGGASRFFPTFRYEAKAGSAERPKVDGAGHATVKPLALIRWLVRLVTRPGGVVLDPFAGSGTTAEACLIEGFDCVTIELEADHLPLIVQRITKPLEPVLFGDGAA